MTKANVLKWLLFAAKYLALASGGASVVGYLPAKWTPYAVLVFGILSVMHDAVIHIGDLVDDGQANDSFKVGLIAVLFLGLAPMLGGCAAISTWWQSDTTQTAARAVLNVVESEALNIGLNALEQYASHGNVSWGNAALSAAPVALRTLEGTPYAGDQAAIQDTVSSWIAAASMKEPVSQQIAQVVASAVAQGASPSAAAEAAARGLDAAVATAPLPSPTPAGE